MLDNETLSDMGKTLITVFDIVETANVGAGKMLSVVAEADKVILMCLPKTITLL